MSAKKSSDSSPAQILRRKIWAGKRTWIEIDRDDIQKNVATFRRLIGPLRQDRGKSRVRLWSVVKSNAYGHGLFTFSKLVDPTVDGFCIDSLVEARALRRGGITRPMLVLGATLPELLPRAASSHVAVSVSNFELLKALLKLKRPPEFHIKVDTGMHRQGFDLHGLFEAVKVMSQFSAKGGKFQNSKKLKGIFTHFAAAKDLHDTRYTDMQLAQFNEATNMFERAGFRNLVRHASATGGALLGKKYHLDAVRVGIGLHGLWPSPELERQLGQKISLAPVLSWRAVVTEVKQIPAGSYIGYDLTERVRRPTTIAVLPVGYWHGFPGSLSSIGAALIRGLRARVLGRVSIDMIVLDATGTGVRVGDVATLIGGELSARDVAQRAGTTHYELVTRLNPLIERVITNNANDGK